MRIGINQLGGGQWTGGITYRRNLLKALKLLDEKPDITLIAQDDSLREDGVEVVDPKKYGTRVRSQINRVSRKVFGRDLVLGQLAKDHQIDVVFPCQWSLGGSVGQAYWIPDFQFMHLPHLYGDENLKTNRKKLLNYFKCSSLIVVSSEDAKSDFEVFAPEYLEKTRVMRFVAHVPEDLYSIDSDVVRRRYHLPEEFIYLPNQFWAHKNHLLVLDALKILKDRGMCPVVVCSGNPIDGRAPLHLARLLLRISELGLREQFILLGLVPHEDLYALIRQSKCVLNPSLFEGWSTTVEESKSVGKRMILSDLAVHKEQDPAGSEYFDRTSAEDLADKLAIVWRDVAPGPDSDLESKARAALPGRMFDFATTFLKICNEATFSRK